MSTHATSRSTQAISGLVLCASLLATGCGTPGAGPAVEDEQEVGEARSSLIVGRRNYLRNLATQFCLDSNSSGSVYTNGCYWATYQEWWVSQGPYGLVLRNAATGRCLDSNTSGSVYTLGCNGGSFQQWTQEWTGSGSIYRLRNVATGRYLDSNTARQVYTLAPNGGSFQKWENFYR